MATSIPPLQGQPGGPSIVTTPQTGAPAKTAIEQATDDARARLAGGGSALPPQTVQQPGEQARVAAGTPAGGQFAESLTRELPAPAGGQPTAAPQTPPVPGAPAPGAPAPAAGTPGAPAAEETPEQKTAREAAERAAETPEAKTAREAEEALAVELPIMVGEGDAAVPLVLHADTPENAAALQELVNQAVAGREAAVVIENATRQLEQAEDMREYAGVDPVGFTLDMIGADIQSGETLALFLLSQPSLFARIKPILSKIVANPAELGNLANEVKAKRADQREAANIRLTESRAIRQNVNDVQATVMSMIPVDMPEAQRRVAFRDMLRDLKDYAEGNNPDGKHYLTLAIHQIPSLLADRLTALGIDADAAASAAAVAAARRSGGSRATGRPGAPAVPAAPRRTPPAPPARAPAPKPNGKAFVTSAANKKVAASIPAAGAGSPGGGSSLNAPPRKQDGSPMSTEETVAWHRGQLAKGIRTY